MVNAVSDVIRLLAQRIAGWRGPPLEAPNAETRAAISELEAGDGRRFDTVDALMADLRGHD